MSSLGADEAVVPESEVKQLKVRVRELERLLGKKTLKVRMLKDAVGMRAKKNCFSQSPLLPHQASDERDRDGSRSRSLQSGGAGATRARRAACPWDA